MPLTIKPRKSRERPPSAAKEQAQKASRLRAIRTSRPRTDKARAASLEVISTLTDEAASSFDYSLRYKQRLYDITKATHHFSGRKSLQKDVNAYCGFSYHDSLAVRFQIDEERSFEVPEWESDMEIPLSWEGMSSTYHSPRDRQRLYDVSQSAYFFSGSTPSQADIDTYCGFTTKSSREARLEMKRTEGRWYPDGLKEKEKENEENKKPKRKRRKFDHDDDEHYDTRHGWSEDEVREMAYAIFANEPDMIQMLDDGWVPKHWI